MTDIDPSAIEAVARALHAQREQAMAAWGSKVPPFAHGQHIWEAQARAAIRAYLAHREAAGFVEVPRNVIEDARRALLYVTAESAKPALAPEAERRFFASHAALSTALKRATRSPETP
jgi:hypothetical protein